MHATDLNKFSVDVTPPQPFLRIGKKDLYEYANILIFGAKYKAIKYANPSR